MFARQHPIKANPAKAGDAKLWVYRHVSDHDRQAAEDHEQRLCLFGLASYSQAFDSDGLSNFTRGEKSCW
jgi:hypothetical protein